VGAFHILVTSVADQKTVEGHNHKVEQGFEEVGMRDRRLRTWQQVVEVEIRKCIVVVAVEVALECELVEAVSAVVLEQMVRMVAVVEEVQVDMAAVFVVEMVVEDLVGVMGTVALV
jgi:hypothetical protein